MSPALHPDGVERTTCRCAYNGTRKVFGLRIFALMKVGIQAHYWSRVLILYMGLLTASVKGKFPLSLASPLSEKRSAC